MTKGAFAAAARSNSRLNLLMDLCMLEQEVPL